MQRFTSSLIAGALLALALPAWADDHHAMEPIVAGQTSVSSAVQQLQANTRTMQSLLDRIAKAKSDGEREQAIADHGAALQEALRLTQVLHGAAGTCPSMAAPKGMGGMGQGGMMGGVPGCCSGKKCAKGASMASQDMGNGAPCPSMGKGMSMGAKKAPCTMEGSPAERIQSLEKRLDALEKALGQPK